jgi:23S rRNA pseudouridine2605 synthase
VQERLQKVLARAGFASRRGAEQLMLEGRVTVNGEVVRELGAKADVETDDVRVDGVRVKAPRALVYLVLNKPRGVVTTRSDPENRPTVMSLVPAVPGLFPVGRLDVTTEGLILLTNDGGFAERVSHPRYEVPRVYHAKVTGVPGEYALERLRRGVRVDEDLMAVDRVRVLEADNNAWVEVTLHEGRQHEVRRLLEAVGHPVSKLRRVAFGPVTTKGLEPGQFRSLTPEEIEGLRKGIGARMSPSRIAIRHRPKAKPAPGRGGPGVEHRGPRRFDDGERRGPAAERRGPRRFEGAKPQPLQRFERDGRRFDGRDQRPSGDRGDRPLADRSKRRFDGRDKRQSGDRGERRPVDRDQRQTDGRRQFGERGAGDRGQQRFAERGRRGFGEGGGFAKGDDRRSRGSEERGSNAKRGRSLGGERPFPDRGQRRPATGAERRPATGDQRPPGPRPPGPRPPGPRPPGPRGGRRPAGPRRGGRR